MPLFHAQQKFANFFLYEGSNAGEGSVAIKVMAKEGNPVRVPYITGEWNCSAAKGEVPFATFICPFLMLCISSTPDRTIRAQRKFLKPIIGLTMRLMARWSCSTTLLRYLFCQTLIG